MITIKSHFTTEVFYVKKMDDEFICTYFIPDAMQVEKDPENSNMVFRMEWMNKSSGELEPVSDEKVLTEMGEFIYTNYMSSFHLPVVSTWTKIKYWWYHKVLRKGKGKNNATSG